MIPCFHSPSRGYTAIRGSTESSERVSAKSLINKIKSLAAISLGIGALLLLLAVSFSSLASLTDNHAALSLFKQILPRIPFKSVVHPVTPSSYWGSVSLPYPTGAFWTNFVVDDGDGAVGVAPYGIRCLAAGIQVSYGAARRSVSKAAITDTFATDLQISAVEAYASHAVQSYDNISVTMGYQVAGGSYTAPLVKGSPFVTVLFDGATPVVSSADMVITSVEVLPLNNSPGSLRLVTLGNYLKWLVFCSSTEPLVWQNSELTTNAPVEAYLRVAIVPLGPNETESLYVLQQYMFSYPVGGKVTFSYPSPSSMILTYTFTAVSQNNCSLLMLALPHHQALFLPQTLLATGNVSSYSPVYSIKGKMTPVVGCTWSLSYRLATSGWTYQTPSVSITTSELNAIAAALQVDVNATQTTQQQVYPFGKQLARMANLALVSDYLGISSVRQQSLSNIEGLLQPWIADSNSDYLVYDRTWGGVVPNGGLQSPQADFGAGWYNDHHFQFGYIIFAGAVLAHLDNTYWRSNRIFFDALVKDVCNSDPTDIDFPFARHKDFYDGHSWASGLFQQANGKSQESSSEVRVDFFLILF
jgi:endo-1,3(4)-beta-glucanase